MAQFPHALGFQLPKVTMDGVTMMNGELETDGQSEKFAKVIGLDFLLGDVVGRVHALDFDSFIANDRLQPLHVVVREWIGKVARCLCGLWLVGISRYRKQCFGVE